MSDISLADLRLLEAILQEGSFRGAAQRLDLPPSTLSRRVSGLERRLGLRMFRRTTRSLSPTPEGLGFLGRVLPALRDIEAAVRGAAEARDVPGGLLRINGTEPGFRLLMPAVRTFLELHPQVELDLVIDGLLSDIVAGGFDAGLRLAEAVPQDMVAVPVGPAQRFVVVGAPGYLARRGRPAVPGDLAAHDCIRSRLPSGRVLAWEFAVAGRPLSLAVTGRLTLGSTDLACQAAREGLGLAYVNDSSAAADLASGALEELLCDWCPPFEGLRLYYPRHRVGSATLSAFVACLRRQPRAE
ncbi:LysR family transcriptional regulator [Oceanicella sp. SM1341]|uniref:LysR family transcriptional regulator n=1 Tax=Oceanicella sp. SM1341 TaxID=1548889 RepID=UPI000E47E0BD|nr:LysR family transcriptional regulator [Oceanicella sp. SM1341]